jgi:hypothetical protein
MPDNAQKSLLLEWSDDVVQVCVPYDWTTEQIVKFAKGMHPTTYESGWRINTNAPRIPCAHRPEFVHVLLGH